MRQVIMNDVTDIWNIQSSCSKIGSDQYIGSAIPEFEQGAVSFLLFHGAMIKYIGNALVC